MFKIEPMNATEFFSYFDFGIYKAISKEGEVVYKLDDWQGANLGNIENDELDLIGAVDRLDPMYYDDYIINGLNDYLYHMHLENNQYDKAYECTHHNRSYKELLNALFELDDEELYGDTIFLYYIINPDKLIDDVKFKEEV